MITRWLAAVALMSCVACSDGEATNTSTSEHAELVAQRVAMLKKAKTSGFRIEKFDCPARTVSDDTAETMLLMWVNNRTDLVDQSKLGAASDDMVQAFQTCGADMSSLTREMQTSDDTLMKGLSVAILQAGRGLS